jgi:hypothetical protein
MDYPQAFGSLLGNIAHLERFYKTDNAEQLRANVEALIKRAKEIEELNEAHVAGVMEKLDAKIKDFAQ